MLFAVGSQSHISFYDVRCGKPVGYINSSDPGAGECMFKCEGKQLRVRSSKLLSSSSDRHPHQC